MRGDKRYPLENGNEVGARGYYCLSYFVLLFDLNTAHIH